MTALPALTVSVNLLFPVIRVDGVQQRNNSSKTTKGQTLQAQPLASFDFRLTDAPWAYSAAQGGSILFAGALWRSYAVDDVPPPGTAKQSSPHGFAYSTVRPFLR